MTRIRRDKGDTPFGRWLRGNPIFDSGRGFDAQNLDYIWHHYLDGKLMLIEEKSYGAHQSLAQKDTHSIIDQALRFACSQMLFSRIKKNRPRKIAYYGYHIIQFEKTSPEDGRVKVDGHIVADEQFYRFLNFEWVPKNET